MFCFKLRQDASSKSSLKSEERAALDDLGIDFRWNSTCDDFERMNGGWIVGENDELLMWVSNDVKREFGLRDTPDSIREFLTKLDFTECKVEPSWYEAYKGKK